MSALATSTTEKLIEVKPRWSGQIGSGGVADGTTTTIPIQSASNLDNGDIYIATINRVNAQGVKQDTWETFIGELSGTNFINCVRRVEGNATTITSWTAGTVIEILFTAKHWNNLIEFLGVEHGSDGTHDSTIIAKLAGTQTFTGAKTFGSGLLKATKPQITTSIDDINGNEVIKTPATASAVNEITVTNAATGNAPKIEATGGDTNIDLKLKGKGTGAIVIEATADSAAEIRLSEDTDNGTNYIGLKAPATISANKTFVLPSADGSADQYIKTDGSGNLSFGSPSSSALSSKIIAATRDLTAASGDVSYTGVGFQPTAIIALSALGGGTEGQSWGMADSSGAERAITRGSNGLGYTGSVLCSIEQSSGALQEAVLKQYDADGFTLTWTKTGSPTGTAVLYFLCLK